MVLCSVPDAEDDEILPGDAEKEFVGKPASDDAPETSVINGEALGIGFQAQESVGKVGEEFIAQSRTSFVIPVVRPAKVGLCPRSEGDNPLHWRDLRILWKTSRQGSPGLGSCSNSVSAS